MKLLIIEEEKGSSRSLLQYLRREGYLCDLSPHGSELPDHLHPSGYDCILINRSDLTSIRIVDTFKKMDFHGGIIFLSVRNTLEGRIAGLIAGADDYLPQSIHFGELNARIAALIRRKHFSGKPLIHINKLTIDLPGMTAFSGQIPLDLTRKEFDLLLFLVSHANSTLSKEAIATNLAEEKDIHRKVDFIYAHIKNLKKKLAATGCPGYIRSIYGMGYKFNT